MEEQRWQQEKEKDILAPILIRLDNTQTLSVEDAKQLHRDCLAEFKQRLVEHANLIRERYDKVQHKFTHDDLLQLFSYSIVEHDITLSVM